MTANRDFSDLRILLKYNFKTWSEISDFTPLVTNPLGSTRLKYLGSRVRIRISFPGHLFIEHRVIQIYSYYDRLPIIVFRTPAVPEGIYDLTRFRVRVRNTFSQEIAIRNFLKLAWSWKDLWFRSFPCVCVWSSVCDVFSQESPLTIFYNFGMKLRIKKCSKVSETRFMRKVPFPHFEAKIPLFLKRKLL